MSEENWYRARHLMPDSILRCEHGTSAICVCIRRFNVDKKYPLTERQVTVAVASFELKRIQRLGIEDDQKYELLRDITQCIEGNEGPYIKAYELLFGPLVPKRTNAVPEPKPRHDPLEPKPIVKDSEPDSSTPLPRRSQPNVFPPNLLKLLLISMSFVVFLIMICSFKMTFIEDLLITI